MSDILGFRQQILDNLYELGHPIGAGQPFPGHFTVTCNEKDGADIHGVFLCERVDQFVFNPDPKPVAGGLGASVEEAYKDILKNVAQLVIKKNNEHRRKLKEKEKERE